jgi:hypothetical protein
MGKGATVNGPRMPPIHPVEIEATLNKVDYYHFFRHVDMDGRIYAAKSEADAAEAEINRLRSRLQALEVTCEGLWVLLKEKLGCTDEELKEAVEGVKSQVDEEFCPSCKRRLLVRSGIQCNWCGHPLDRPFG